MVKQIFNLTKLQLKNLYGINVFRFTKDKKEKRNKLFLAAAYLILMIILFGYMGGMAYGYIFMGMSTFIPAYLIMVSSVIVFVFSIFKAGSVIFQKNSYDILTSMPISPTAIVVSRFIRMYVENLVFVLIIMLPAMLVYGILLKPAISFYLIGLQVMIFIPFLPMSAAVFLGALITAIASGMKHKNLVSAGLSVLLVMVIMLLTTRMSMMTEEFSIEMLKNLSEIVLEIIGSLYPPAVWLGNAMLLGDYGICLLCVAGEIILFVAVIAIISVNYHRISRGLYSTGAKHNYQMRSLKKVSVLGALYKREFRRYFSSSVYVTNTIVGPIMAVLFAVTLLVVGEEQLQVVLELPIDIKGGVPFLLASIFCMMPTTCTSVSMEGKEWWIVKSLPIRSKDIFDSKILLYLSLTLPFFLVSEILIGIALKTNLTELLWLLAIPTVMILFSGVWGITVNLKMPVFEWENEVTIVKQSASAFFGGIGGFLIVLLCMIPAIILPELYANLWKSVICVVTLGITFVLYQKNNRVNLQEL